MLSNTHGGSSASVETGTGSGNTTPGRSSASQVTESGNTSTASVATESSGSGKWPVRALDEADVSEDNLDRILKGRYEDADKPVQELFLFIYCDCALNSMGKVPRERAGETIKVKNYFEKFPAITCAMIKVVVLEDEKIRKKEAAAQTTGSDREESENEAATNQAGGRAAGEENQENTQVVNGGPAATDGKEKSKGGRPKGVLNFDKGMQGEWQKYTNTEFNDRKASEEDGDKMTWYEAAVTEMDRKTASKTPVASVEKETSSGTEGGQGGEQDTSKEKGKSDLMNMAFLTEINMEEV